MRNVIMILLASFAGTSALADDSAKVKALEKRIQELEERVAKLESCTAPAVAKARAGQMVNAQRMKARARMRKDASVYSRDELREVESLYQARGGNSEERKDSLKQLVESFPKANRTGCALLYLGQMSKGKEREDYLQKAIDGFNDCYYGDGVQVGAYARYYLAYYYKENGLEKKAEELFREIRSKYPDAINHKGQPLAGLMDN